MSRSEAGHTPVEPAKRGRIPAEDLPGIAERYRSGESLKLIGQGYGVSDEAVRQRLERWALAAGESYGELATEYLLENAIVAKDKIVGATDLLGLARAREETKYWLWMLERRRPKLFGPKQEINTDKTVTVIVQRSRPLPISNEIPAQALPNYSSDETQPNDAA